MTGPFRAKPSQILAWLRAKGYSGTVYDAMNNYFGTFVSAGGTLADKVNALMSSYGYTGTLQDKLNKFFTQSTGLGNRDDAENLFFLSSAYSFSDLVQNSLLSFGGLTFYKNFVSSQTSLNADFAAGSNVGSIVAARSGSSPATYYDAAGGLQTLTTANVPRWTQGYYDQTGFVSKPGLLVESGGGLTTGRNNVLRSAAFTDVAWTATSITASDAESGTPLVTTASSITATGVDGTLTQAVTDAVAGKYTASIFIKRKTGTGTISLRANTVDGYTDITANVGASWTRVQVTSSSATNPTFDLKISTSGDAVYIYGAQLEKFPWMTSYIPTAAAVVTRAAETVTYPIANNRTVSTESIFIKFTPLGSTFANDNVQRTLLSSDTKARQLHKSNSGTTVRTIPNNNDSSAVTAISTTVPAVGTSFVTAGTMQHNLPYAYVYAYGNGVQDGTYTAGDWTDNAWGTNFQVGAAAASNNQANCIIESIAIYSDWKQDPDVNHISYVMSPSTVTYRNYVFTPSTSSASNLVSGSAGTGNVVTNPTNYYLWMDTYACSDSGWVGGANRTGETWRCFKEEGSDSERASPPTSAPVGDIVMRTYTKSTNTMSDPPVTIWTDATYQANEIMAFRVPTENFIRVYFSMATRTTPNTKLGIYCIKSTDLTCSAWGSPVLCISGDIQQVWCFVDLQNGNKALVIGETGAALNNKVTLYSTPDYDNFSYYSQIAGSGSNNPEGGIVGDGQGRMIAILRKSTGDFLLQATSTDWGVTWTSLFSTGLGAAGGAKVKPRIRIAAGNPNRVMVYFYDRGDNRLKIGTPTLFSDAFAGTWLQTYLIGTSAQGNGGFEIIDDTQLRYLVSTQSGSEPTNDFRWWLFKDIYTWVAQ